MKTLKISDDVHQKLTGMLGELTAQTQKLQTYQDAIEAMLTHSVIIPSELLAEVENFIKENKKRGFTTKEEFVRDAVRFRLDWFNEEYEYFEVSKETLEKMDAIMDAMTEALGMPASANAVISEAIDNAVESILENYRNREHEWDKQTRREVEERIKEIEEYWDNLRRRT